MPLGEQLLHPLAVGLEPDDHLLVNHQRGRRTAFPPVHQFVISRWICLDVLPFIGDSLLPKELFGRPTVPSAGLVVQDNPLHGEPSSLGNIGHCRPSRWPHFGQNSLIIAPDTIAGGAQAWLARALERSLLHQLSHQRVFHMVHVLGIPRGMADDKDGLPLPDIAPYAPGARFHARAGATVVSRGSRVTALVRHGLTGPCNLYEEECISSTKRSTHPCVASQREGFPAGIAPPTRPRDSIGIAQFQRKEGVGDGKV
jgi:hypothetical protein